METLLIKGRREVSTELKAMTISTWSFRTPHISGTVDKELQMPLSVGIIDPEYIKELESQ